KKSAGIYLRHENKIFLVQPTGSSGFGIPKGYVEDGESPEEAARREFEEETGIDVSALPLEYLNGSADIKGGKKIHAFIGSGDGTETYIGSNIIQEGFRAGQPENCSGGYFTLDEASRLVHKNQARMLQLYKVSVAANDERDA
ncbi:unnamed protein product, partial [Ectocarpus fasciculatus]